MTFSLCTSEWKDSKGWLSRYNVVDQWEVDFCLKEKDYEEDCFYSDLREFLLNSRTVKEVVEDILDREDEGIERFFCIIGPHSDTPMYEISEKDLFAYEIDEFRRAKDEA